MKQHFDYIKFGKALKTKRSIDMDVGLRFVATKLSISAATLSRMENGGVAELDNIISVCDWLNVSICDFIVYSKSKDTRK